MKVLPRNLLHDHGFYERFPARGQVERVEKIPELSPASRTRARVALARALLALGEHEAASEIWRIATDREHALHEVCSSACQDYLEWFGRGDTMPERMVLPLERTAELRYGELQREPGAAAGRHRL